MKTSRLTFGLPAILLMKTFRVVFALLAFLLLVSACTRTIGAPRQTAKRIDAYMARWHDNGHFNGAVLVARRGEVLHEKGYGFANLEWGTPNAPDTRFLIGSLTKQFTAVMVYQLVEEGRLDPNGHMTDYLPEYRKDTGDKVTIDQLLRHTSGLESHTSQPDFWTRTAFLPYQKDEALIKFHSGDLVREPGEPYRYNNTGYCLLGAVLERVTGATYSENLRTRILEPLGMVDSGVERPEEILERRAAPYLPTPTGFANGPRYYMPNFAGTGDMYSTARDLLRWNEALFAGDFLPEKVRTLMTTVYYENEPSFGQAVSNAVLKIPFKDADAVTAYEFNSALPGYNADVFRFPDEGIVVVLLSNGDEADFWRMAPALYRIVQGLPQEAPLPSALDELARVALEQGVDAAYERYQVMRKAEAEVWDLRFGEYELNKLGYRLMSLARFEDAVRVLELNVRFNPESFNVYDSLGEALYGSSRYQPAIDAYQQSLRINPNNGNAKEMLARIGEEAKKKGAPVVLAEADSREIPSQETVLEVFRSEGFEAAMGLLEAARGAFPDLVMFRPQVIGPAFERTLEHEGPEQALALCRLWAAGNPTSVGPWFSMARVYRSSGELAEAKRCYEKILEIAPEGRHVEAARKGLEEVSGK